MHETRDIWQANRRKRGTNTCNTKPNTLLYDTRVYVCLDTNLVRLRMCSVRDPGFFDKHPKSRLFAKTMIMLIFSGDWKTRINAKGRPNNRHYTYSVKAKKKEPKLRTLFELTNKKCLVLKILILSTCTLLRTVFLSRWVKKKRIWTNISDTDTLSG